MRLVIETSWFAANPAAGLRAVALFRHGLAGRHRVLPEDDLHPTFLAWLGRFGDLAEEMQVSINASFDAEKLSPSAHEVRLADIAAPSFTDSVPRLPLADVERLLDKTFKVVVENNVSDRAFWLSVCSPEQRTVLERWERDGFVEFAHGGGLGQMETLATGLAGDKLADLRHFFLFDSDALQPGTPSPASERLRGACRRIPSHQLKRRYAESYLPRKTLHGWAYATGRSRKVRVPLFKAFVTLSPPQWHHYPMKTGFAGDQRGRLSNGETTGDLYDNLTAEAIRSLANGFGPNIGALFQPPGAGVAEGDLRHDGAWSELNPVVSRVLAAIR